MDIPLQANSTFEYPLNLKFMKKVILLSVLFPLICLSQHKNEWFFGAEIGNNIINSFQLGEPNKSFQGGIVAEYYTGESWSLIGRIKYFKTGVSFYSQSTHSGSWFDLGSDGYFGVFNGSVISIPVDIKNEFNITSKIKGNVKLGLAYNREIKSEYYFSSNLNTDNSKSFTSLNAGFGINYYLTNKTAFYIDLETYQLGGYKASSNGLVFTKNYYTTNNLINIGIKHNFKK